jgi:hypothetical protein
MTDFEKELVAQNAILVRQMGQIAGDLRRLTSHLIESEQAKEKVRRGPIEVSPEVLEAISHPEPKLG